MAIMVPCICAPDDSVVVAFRDKMAMHTQALERYASIREKPAISGMDDGLRCI